MKLRYYQDDAVQSTYDYLRRTSTNPCIVIPTGGGKTPVLATISRDAVQRWNGRVCILAHVKELLEQSVNKLQAICPDIPVGVYSAGLKRRDVESPIIVAGIQSVYKRACELGAFNLILIDEAHMLPPDGEGMYQQFLADAKTVNPNVRLIGLTATPFRLKSGELCGPDNLLNDVSYEISVKELINQGYLCPVLTKAMVNRIDTSGLHIRAGEFIASEVEDLVNGDDMVLAACREVVHLTEDRKSVLIFGASVPHAEQIQHTIQRLTGSECGLVTGDTPADERDVLLRRFKGERIQVDLFGGETAPLKYLVNVNVLTTGFDAPNIDCVAMLRPTASPGLYYQMVGRGFRLSPEKQNCLILDYGENIRRHGPVDALIPQSKRGGGGGVPPMKECPECQTVMLAAFASCPECDYQFPPAERTTTHETSASEDGIISGQVIDIEYDVCRVEYRVHTKKGATEDDPRTMRVMYYTSIADSVSEWVCPEHEPGSFAYGKFCKWWDERSNYMFPESAQHAVDIAENGGLAEPSRIKVRTVTGERFPRIIDYQLGPVPDVQEMPDLSEIPF